MKTVLKLIVFSIIISCKAQTIIPLYNENANIDDIMNSSKYFKDVDNDFDAYEGTWQGTLENGELTITFNKVVHHFSGGQTYDDILVGEYQYMENGIMLVDSNPNPITIIDNNGVPKIVNQDDPWENCIGSINIVTDNRGFPPCPECAPNTRFIILGICDPTRPNVVGETKMVRFVENGIEKIRMRIYATYVYDHMNISYPGYLTIPENSIWTLTKVE